MEQERNEKLFEVGNLLHDSVPVSNDEVCDETDLLSSQSDQKCKCGTECAKYLALLCRMIKFNQDLHDRIV